jgi:hypothetical protein
MATTTNDDHQNFAKEPKDGRYSGIHQPPGHTNVRSVEY